MSAIIPAAIPRQAFELVRDRICQILVEEFENQYLLSYDEDFNLQEGVYMERMVPFNVSELPALNVGMERGDYTNKHQGAVSGRYSFFVECNTAHETEEDRRGDTASKMMAQKLLGVARAILSDPRYKTLGFTPGVLIQSTRVESFVFAEPTRYDAENVTMARLTFIVEAVETNPLIVAPLIEGWDTEVKLGQSTHGFYWSKQTS